MFFLYGLTSVVYCYVISLFTTSQLATFAFASGSQCILFLIYFIAYVGDLSMSLILDSVLTIEQLPRHPNLRPRGPNRPLCLRRPLHNLDCHSSRQHGSLPSARTQRILPSLQRRVRRFLPGRHIRIWRANSLPHRPILRPPSIPDMVGLRRTLSQTHQTHALFSQNGS